MPRMCHTCRMQVYGYMLSQPGLSVRTTAPPQSSFSPTPLTCMHELFHVLLTFIANYYPVIRNYEQSCSFFQKISESMDVDPSNTTNKQTVQHSVDGEHSMEMDEFPFPSSQGLDDTFREATLVSTLAESFSLTHFKEFQKEVIKATLDGRDSVVLQPTGSGKSLCFQFPPIYENKKAVVIKPNNKSHARSGDQFEREGDTSNSSWFCPVGLTCRIECFRGKRRENYFCYT